MTPRNALISLALLIATLGPSVAAGPRIASLDDEEGADVRAAASTILTAVANGDANLARSNFVGSPEQQDLLDAYLKSALAANALHASLERRFGKDASSDSKISDLMRLRAEAIRNRLVMISGDSAHTSSRALDPGLTLRRVGGVWKVSEICSDGEKVAETKTFWTAFSDATDEIRAKVEARKVDSATTAAQQLDQRIRPAFEEWVEAPTKRMIAPATRSKGASKPLPISTAELQGLQGRQIVSPEIERLVAWLPGLPQIVESPQVVFVTSKEAGISLAFNAPTGSLGTIFLYADGADGYCQYSGDLPKHLLFADRRRDVENRLGPPEYSGGGVLSRYWASYPRLKMGISYDGNSAKDAQCRIREISLHASEPPHSEWKAPRRTRKPRVEFRFVAADPKADGPTVEPLLDPDDQSHRVTLPILREVLLDESAIADVTPSSVSQDPKLLGIALTMTADGAERLAEITSRNEGRRLAVVMDGQLLFAPAIRGKLSGSLSIQLGRSRTSQEIYDLQGRLHAAVFALPNNDAAPSSESAH